MEEIKKNTENQSVCSFFGFQPGVSEHETGLPTSQAQVSFSSGQQGIMHYDHMQCESKIKDQNDTWKKIRTRSV
jgi:hypothetical protein